MRGRLNKLGRVVSVLVSVAMVCALSFAPALANAADESQGLTATDSLQLGLPEWAVDDGENAQDGLATQAVLPSKYDLRDEGLVTPVKRQDPWGSCWSFGSTAAVETSLLSAFGTTYADTVANGDPLNLSERHLVYFAKNHITEADNPKQAGEGMYLLDSSNPTQDATNPNEAFVHGGGTIYATTLFSQGVGPVSESLWPYRGENARTTLDDFDDNADANVQARLELEGATLKNMTADEYLQYLADVSGKSKEEIFANYKATLRQMDEDKMSYSKNDDWTIPRTNADGMSNRLVSGGVVLKNGNVLPNYWEDKNDAEPSAAGVQAIKQELLNGRGICFGYHADVENGKYAKSDEGMTNRCYHYVGDSSLSSNHCVCIVGWDDDFAASNFTHTKDLNNNQLTDNEGKPLSDEEATALTTPPGNGAWIVKNSWGSEADAGPDDLGNVVNRAQYGFIDEDPTSPTYGLTTGYIYISYYDKTIEKPETMEFSADLGSGGSFATLQYDYMPSLDGFFTTEQSDEVVSSANKFEADCDMVVKSVSTRTSEANMRATFAVYLLDGGADVADITPSTKPATRVSRNFEYGGFHRLDLDRPLTVKAGQKIVVVSTVSTVDTVGRRHYSVSANQGKTKKAATAEGEHNISYCKAVVNPGESFLYENGAWQDWGSYLENTEAVKSGDKAVDNFSIKLYADASPDISGASVKVAKATYTGKALEPEVTVELGGSTLAEGADYEVTYADNTDAGTGVAVIEGVGKYTGVTTKTFPIAKAKNALKAKAVKATQKVKSGKATTIAAGKAFRVTKNTSGGEVTYALVSVPKKAKGKIAVSPTGDVSVDGGLGKGTYEVKTKLTSAETANYKAKSTKVSFKVKVN